MEGKLDQISNILLQVVKQIVHHWQACLLLAHVMILSADGYVNCSPQIEINSSQGSNDRTAPARLPSHAQRTKQLGNGT